MYRHAMNAKVENRIVVANELDSGVAEFKLDGRRGLGLVVILAESEVVSRLLRAVNVTGFIVVDAGTRDFVQRVKLGVHEVGGVVSVVAVDAHDEEIRR